MTAVTSVEQPSMTGPERVAKILATMGSKQWTRADLSAATGIEPLLLYDYLVKLKNLGFLKARPRPFKPPKRRPGRPDVIYWRIDGSKEKQKVEVEPQSAP